jgi:hypothetical protein
MHHLIRTFTASGAQSHAYDAINASPFPSVISQAPGENFKENNPFEDLPNRVLHPWPAMQEFQFHVR